MTPWYKSKQFYFNVLTVVISLAAAFGFQEFTPDPRTAVIAQLLVAVINVALRFAFPSDPPPARLEKTKSGAPVAPTDGIIQPPTRTHQTPNRQASAIFAGLTLSIIAGIALAT